MAWWPLFHLQTRAIIVFTFNGVNSRDTSGGFGRVWEEMWILLQFKEKEELIYLCVCVCVRWGEKRYQTFPCVQTLTTSASRTTENPFTNMSVICFTLPWTFSLFTFHLILGSEEVNGIGATCRHCDILDISLRRHLNIQGKSIQVHEKLLSWT